MVSTGAAGLALTTEMRGRVLASRMKGMQIRRNMVRPPDDVRSRLLWVPQMRAFYCIARSQIGFSYSKHLESFLIVFSDSHLPPSCEYCGERRRAVSRWS